MKGFKRFNLWVTCLGVLMTAVLLLSVQVMAADEETPGETPKPTSKVEAQFYATDATTSPGGIVPVEIAIKGNPGIWAVKFKVDYDKSVLTLTDIQSVKGSIFDFDKELTLPIDIEKRDTVFVAASDEYDVNKTADGSIVKLLFKVNNNVGNMVTKVDVKVIQSINVAEDEIDFKERSGQITIYVPSPAEEEHRKGVAIEGEEDIKSLFFFPINQEEKNKKRRKRGQEAEVEENSDIDYRPELISDEEEPATTYSKTIILTNDANQVTMKGNILKVMAIVLGGIALIGAAAYGISVLVKRRRR